MYSESADFKSANVIRELLHLQLQRAGEGDPMRSRIFLEAAAKSPKSWDYVFANLVDHRCAALSWDALVRHLTSRYFVYSTFRKIPSIQAFR